VSFSSSHRLQLADPFPRKTRGPFAEEASAIDALSMPLFNPCTIKQTDFPLSVTNEYWRVGGVNYCTNCTIPVRSRGARSTYQIHLFSLMLFLFQSTSHNREHIVYKKGYVSLLHKVEVRILPQRYRQQRSKSAELAQPRC
jgi:hypothetical protein